MLFKFTKNNAKSVDTPALLKALRSNGIDLSMNELIEYQSKSSLINLTPKRNLRGKMSGNFLSRSKGRGMEFDEVRHYQTGDDIRAIDWRVTARTGKTHTKLFREEVERPVLIATDLSNSMLFGSQLLFKSVQAAHIASLVAWHAKSRGDRIGGMVFNQDKHSELKPRSRKEGVLHYLHILVKHHQESLANLFTADVTTTNTQQTDGESITAKAGTEEDNFQHQAFANNCARIRHIARPGSLVYLITDGQHINDNSIRHLSHISRHCELVVCIISDSLEQKLPDSRHKINVAITDGHQRQSLLLGDKKIAHRYQEQAKLRTHQLEQQLGLSGARIIHFSAGDSLENQLKYDERS